MDVDVSTYWLIDWCLGHLNVHVLIGLVLIGLVPIIVVVVVVGLTFPAAISGLTL